MGTHGTNTPGQAKVTGTGTTQPANETPEMSRPGYFLQTGGGSL